MRVDAYTHFMPSRMFKKLIDSNYPDIGKRMREVPCIHDLISVKDLTLVLKSLKKRPLDYFKHTFYADTATFSAEPAMHAGLAFYDLDKIVFASHHRRDV